MPIQTEIDSPTARADSSAWKNLALVGHRRREETALVGPYCSAQGTYSKQCACFLQHPLIINQHDAAARCRRNHGTKGVGHERAPLSLIVTTTHSRATLQLSSTSLVSMPWACSLPALLHWGLGLGPT